VHHSLRACCGAASSDLHCMYYFSTKQYPLQSSQRLTSYYFAVAIRLCPQTSNAISSLALVNLWVLITCNAFANSEAYEVNACSNSEAHAWSQGSTRPSVAEPHGHTSETSGVTWLDREVFCLFLGLKQGSILSLHCQKAFVTCMFFPTHSKLNEIETTKDTTEQLLLFLQL